LAIGLKERSIKEKSDGSEMAQYGRSLPSAPPMIIRSYRAWAIYDVSRFDPAIQVRELAVNNYLYPAVDVGHATIYGRLTEDPRPAGAETCWSALVGAVYAEAETPIGEGEISTVLGELASDDFESAFAGAGLFMPRIEGSGDTDDMVWVKEWQEGMPRLTVVYEDFLPADSAPWGGDQSALWAYSVRARCKMSVASLLMAMVSRLTFTS
jgi:hypothetical protein